jgi:hypothetical protein
MKSSIYILFVFYRRKRVKSNRIIAATLKVTNIIAVLKVSDIQLTDKYAKEIAIGICVSIKT